MISLVPRLYKEPHKAICGPGSTGFTTKKSADRCPAAVNFVFFHSHIHVCCPWISSDHVDLQAKNLLEQFRNIEPPCCQLPRHRSAGVRWLCGDRAVSC